MSIALEAVSYSIEIARKYVICVNALEMVRGKSVQIVAVVDVKTGVACMNDTAHYK